ncbi:hypothetical protein ACXZ7E_29780 [Paenibacillus lautus]
MSGDKNIVTLEAADYAAFYIYVILVHPVVVNVGEHLFDNLMERKDFHLVDVKTLTDGSLLVTYEPAKA